MPLDRAAFLEEWERVCLNFRHDPTPQETSFAYRVVAGLTVAAWRRRVAALCRADRFPLNLTVALDPRADASQDRAWRAPCAFCATPWAGMVPLFTGPGPDDIREEYFVCRAHADPLTWPAGVPPLYRMPRRFCSLGCELSTTCEHRPQPTPETPV